MRSLVFILSLFPFFVFTQTGWQPLKEIYSQNGLKIEYQFYISKQNVCQGGRPYKFRYKLTGRVINQPSYLSWDIEYLDCNGNLYREVKSLPINQYRAEDISNGVFDESIDYRIEAKQIEKEIHNIRTTNRDETSRKNLGRPRSIKADRITGPNKIYFGQSLKLSVSGGALGIGAEWVWYEDQCGGIPIGKGKTLDQQPTRKKIYFVRAEGRNNRTQCVQITVDVDKRSSAPSTILGRVNICEGESTNLTVSGGSLGEGAKWYWYEDKCGGRRIGTGESIRIQPQKNTKYFVRAESKINITPCASMVIGVYQKPSPPTSIRSTKNSAICEGEKVTLSTVGGRLTEGTSLKWYAERCSGQAVGSGSQISVTPSRTTTYYLRAENPCNNTSCLSFTVKVNNKSIRPSGISVPYNVYKGEQVTAKVSGGKLGRGAEWHWYKDNTLGSTFKKGSSISLKIRKPTRLFVKAIGLCDGQGTPFVQSQLIEPRKARSWSAGYSNKRKFFHFGLGLGLEWMQLTESAQFRSNNSINGFGSDSIDINGLGLQAEMVIHPIMKDYFSLGFLSSFSIGSSPQLISRQSQSGRRGEDNYFYNRFRLGTELAFGFKPVKLLLIVDKELQQNDFDRTTSQNITYTFDDEITRESLKFGLRIGSYYSKNNSRGGSLDLLYTLTRNTDSLNLLSFKAQDEKGFSHWRPGLSVVWWKQSAIRINFTTILAAPQNSFDFFNPNFKGATYRLSILWNRNRFI